MMDSDIGRLNRDFEYIDEDNSLTQKEKKEAKEEAQRMFDYRHGLSVDFVSEINIILKKLEEVGYRELKLKEFNDEMQKIIAAERKNVVSDYNILSKLKFYCRKKCDELKELKDRLGREIEYIKQHEQSRADEYIKEAQTDYYLKIGGSFEPKDIIADYINQLRMEGYSENRLEFIKMEISSKVNSCKNESNSVLKNHIDRFFEKKIEEIRRDRERKDKKIEYIKNKADSVNYMDYTSIYGREVVDNRISSQIGIIENRFNRKYGHNCIDELLNNYKKYAESYGISEESFAKICKKIQDKIGELSINELEKELLIEIRENNSCISIFNNNLEDVRKFATAYYGNDVATEKDFIKDYLSLVADDKKRFCKEVDRRYLEHVKRHRGNDNLASLFEDDDYVTDMVKANIESIDKMQDQLFDTQNRMVFTSWLSAKKAEESVSTFASSFKRRT